MEQQAESRNTVTRILSSFRGQEEDIITPLKYLPVHVFQREWNLEPWTAKPVLFVVKQIPIHALLITRYVILSMLVNLS